VALPTPPSPPSPPSPPPLPAACADCVTTLQSAQPGAVPQQFPHSLARAADGKMRIDYPNTSVIRDPAAQRMIVLDHIKKEARSLPLPQETLPKPPAPQVPGAAAPALSMAAVPPGVAVKELGKKMVEGMELEGRQYTMPAVPGMPRQPALPGMPGMPGMPKPPVPPAASLVSEVWTSTALKLPVLTRVTGPFGKQTCICKNVRGAEPDPSLFKIPADYKTIGSVTPPKL